MVMVWTDFFKCIQQNITVYLIPMLSSKISACKPWQKLIELYLNDKMVSCIQIKSLLIVYLIGPVPFYAWNYRDIHKNNYLHCRYNLKFQNYILQPEFIQIVLKILGQMIPYLNSLAILSHYCKTNDYLLLLSLNLLNQCLKFLFVSKAKHRSVLGIHWVNKLAREKIRDMDIFG